LRSKDQPLGRAARGRLRLGCGDPDEPLWRRLATAGTRARARWGSRAPPAHRRRGQAGTRRTRSRPPPWPRRPLEQPSLACPLVFPGAKSFNTLLDGVTHLAQLRPAPTNRRQLTEVRHGFCACASGISREIRTLAGGTLFATCAAKGDNPCARTFRP